ncbi:craniofacial development protein 2-like [Nilaparvata lugens]|uniref:craniofacial development protein 2-like n=1 Tax=Nilaparvata lugens TaxID=108931 RepID=UPI00193D3830|nr:craniofacial development protein 2-like [Nilaparvata lugens]
MAMLAAKFNSGVSSSIGSPGGAVSSVTERLKCQNEIRIGTWNVKTMSQSGKIHNAIQEMTHMKLSVMGVCEMRWPGSGSLKIQDHQVYFSGTDNDKHELRVCFIMTKGVAKCVDNVIPVSSRLILVQLKAKPVNINIIQVYAPTTDGTDEEVEEFYNSINEIMRKLKKQDLTIVIGDFNAKLGSGRTSSSVGPFGLGNRNARGDSLETFAESNQLVVMNTWFKLHPRRLYTWKSPMDRPGRIVRNQIDFLLVNRRFWNSCLSVKTYPGADIQSDHTPLVGRFKIRLKKVTSRKVKSYDLRKLKDPAIQQVVKNALNENLRSDINVVSIEGGLATMQEEVKIIKDQYLEKDSGKRKSWMTDEILELMEQRKWHKDNLIEYRRIQIIIRKKIREAKEREKVEQCQEIEFHLSRYDSFNVHRKVREVAGKFRNGNIGRIADGDGILLISKEDKKKVWEQYLQDLFHDLRVQQPAMEDSTGPKILLEEMKGGAVGGGPMGGVGGVPGGPMGGAMGAGGPMAVQQLGMGGLGPPMGGPPTPNSVEQSPRGTKRGAGGVKVRVWSGMCQLKVYPGVGWFL